MPIPAYRITDDALVVKAQSTTPGTQTPGSQATPPGAAETEGAFGIFGMMISGLIIIFAIVLLYLRSRNSR
jgi:hypothetical protein